MIFATRKLAELRRHNAALQKTIEHQGDIIARLKSELSLSDGRIRHLEVALERCRQKLRDALEKLGDEPPEHDLILSFSE